MDIHSDISTKRGAQQFLGDYRTLYKRWVMTATGVVLGDDAALLKQIEAGTTLLAQISNNHPELSESVEMLSKMRTRTFVSDLAKAEYKKRQG